ncbi:MAG: hypothetical protein QOH56_453 [Pseudonocardiales bacterium]|jgi:hypothetical protein|nr:hypothetical protein [Pseudonocardiales bacterium]
MITAGITCLGNLDDQSLRGLLRDCSELAQSSDNDLAAEFLAEQPTHAGRDADLIRRWAGRATEFGARLELEAGQHQPLRVVERSDGIDQMLLAQFSSRPVPTVELYTDAVALAEELTAVLGWRGWFPEGTVRLAAEAHEAAHCHLQHHQAKRELKRALDASAGQIGRLRFLAHIVGADELAAHSYAQRVVRLGRSPLLLSAALGLAAELIRSN